MVYLVLLSVAPATLVIMTNRKRGTGATVTSGYGQANRAERARRVKAYMQGLLTACGICSKPLPPPGSCALRKLALAHLPDRSGYYPSLAHAACNMSQTLELRAQRMRDRAGRPAEEPGEDHSADPRYRECVTAEDRIMGMIRASG